MITKSTPQNDSKAWLENYKNQLDKVYVEMQDPYDSDGQICKVRPYIWIRMRKNMLPIPCWLDVDMAGPYANRELKPRGLGKGNPITFFGDGPLGSRVDAVTGLCTSTIWPEGHDGEFWVYHNKSGKPTHYTPFKQTSLFKETFL